MHAIPRLFALCLIGIWSACSAHALAAEPPFLPDPQNDVDKARGPVRQLIITTKESIATLSFSRPRELTHRITRHRDDPSDSAGETMLYRYDSQGRKIGEYMVDNEGALVPMRLYVHTGDGQVAAESTYHLCRTFSSLHIYTYDGRRRLITDVEFASRRLTRQEFQYDAKGQVERTTTHRNGRLLSITRYTHDDLGRIATVASEQPDGAVMSRLYLYDEHGSPIVFGETHPRDPAQDKTEVTTYKYDPRATGPDARSSEQSTRSTMRDIPWKNRSK